MVSLSTNFYKLICVDEVVGLKEPLKDKELLVRVVEVIVEF